jgi:peptidoglycan/xylan/chitin deacetylase (PgdA/CDA1 family)
MAMMNARKIGVITAIALLTSGCGPGGPPNESAVPAVAPTPQPVAPIPSVIAIDLDQVQPNELGQVPVLMYHRLVANPKSVYDRTPADFRAELQRLAAENYVPITTADFATGHIDIPAGSHPVVLTFDDGDATTFELDENSRPATGTAVQILLEVAASHPGFTPVASMYVNEHPFGDADGTRALPWLRDHGFEIGNHTRHHTNLRKASSEEARRAISEGDDMIRSAVPGYRPSTLALPYGAQPRSPSDSIRGQSYDYVAALLVGANPATSPYSNESDPLKIPRIRSQGSAGEDARYGSTSWLDSLARSPRSRYTSDGDPLKVSFPKENTNLAPRFASLSRPY